MVFQKTTGQGTGSRSPNTTFGSNFRVKPGAWYTVKTYAKLNTATGSSSNGMFQMWIDGNLVMSHSDVEFLGPGELSNKITTAQFCPVFGGNMASTKPSADYFYVDDFRISDVDFNTYSGSTIIQNPAPPSNLVK